MPVKNSASKNDSEPNSNPNSDSISDLKAAEVAELKALFKEYTAREQAVTSAKDAVEDAINRRSAVLKKIVDLSGTGPYNLAGRIVKIVARGETYFLRGKGSEGAIDV